MHRCFVDPSEWGASDVELSPVEEHHLLHVLRVAPGETVLVFDGQGREARAQMVAASRSEEAPTSRNGKGRGIRLPIVGHARVDKAMTPRLTLIQALPKGGRMDGIVEKATELGVSTIFPVTTEHVVTRWGKRQAQKHVERWARVAVSAAKQCGLLWLPEIKPVSGLQDVMSGLRAYDLLIVGSLQPEAQPLRSLLNEKRGGKLRDVAVCIGPEGDFSPRELESIVNAGAQSASFGRHTLRVDTAALYALSVLSYELR